MAARSRGYTGTLPRENIFSDPPQNSIPYSCTEKLMDKYVADGQAYVLREVQNVFGISICKLHRLRPSTWREITMTTDVFRFKSTRRLPATMIGPNRGQIGSSGMTVAGLFMSIQPFNIGGRFYGHSGSRRRLD